MAQQYRKPVVQSEAQRNRNEIRNLKEKSTHVTNETVSKTRELLRIVNETKATGASTLQELYYQGEQLDRTENALEATDDHLDKAEVRLSNIEKGHNAPCCCLPCVSWCQKDPDKKKLKKKNKASKSKHAKDKEETGSMSIGQSRNGKGDNRDAKENERFFPKILGTNCKEEDEIEKNLDDVSKHVSHLKMMALDMDSEVTKQNEQIDRMNDKAERSLGRVDAASQRTKDIANDKPKSKSCCCWCC